MLDIRFIRENSDRVKKGCERKNAVCDVDGVLSLDEKRKELVTRVENLRAEQHKLGKADIETATKLKSEIKELEPKLQDVENALHGLLLQFPNMPFEDVPI